MIAQPQNNLLVTQQIYGKILAEIDAPEELLEFVQKLANQNNAMAKVIQKCEQKDTELAQIYYHLVASIDAINEGNEEGTVFDGVKLEKVRKIAVEAVFLLAKRMEISLDQIVDSKKKNENKIEILNKLVKNWDQNNCNWNESDKNDEENEQKSHQKQRERLRLILAGIGDGSIVPVKILSKNSKSDGSSRNRRRRKKRNDMLIAIIVVLVVVIVAVIACYFGRACDGSSSASASAGANKSASKSAISSKTEGARK
ncbi:hypothetical protein niasHS_017279 [Heterodera schachtii]|uniref:Uncharacterized protein n=1 Tax=Heterodera schachtii TaxID=97005 RepID=A0ABD2HYS7_HETSC